MKSRTEISRSLTEIRGRMADLLAKQEAASSDEERASVGKEFDLETRKLDALKADVEALQLAEREDVDKLNGDPQFEALTRRTSLREYVQATMDERKLTPNGAEDELDQELREKHQRPSGSGTWVPWGAMAPEVRADAASTGPAGNTGERATFVSRVFSALTAAFMGVRFTDVPAGASEFIVQTGGVDPSLAARGTQVDSDAVAMTLNSLTPTRMSAAYLFACEDAMRLGSGYEAQLRSDLNRGVSAKIDEQILVGNGTAPNFDGFFNRGTAAPKTTTKVTYTKAIERLIGDGLDGLYAYMQSHVRSVIGPGTAAVLASLAANSSKGDISALSYIDKVGGGVRVSNHVAAPSRQ